MIKRSLAIIVALGVLAAVLAACGAVEHSVLGAAIGGSSGGSAQAVAQAPTAVATIEPLSTPEFSVLASPTPLPTLAGPMGTLTAIADLVASPTQDTEPYTITLTGNPHFIEFHAWW
jgi:hypothetical protein